MSVAQLARTGVLDQPVASTSYNVSPSIRRPTTARRGAVCRPRATAVRDSKAAVSLYATQTRHILDKTTISYIPSSASSR